MSQLEQYLQAAQAATQNNRRPVKPRPSLNNVKRKPQRERISRGTVDGAPMGYRTTCWNTFR